VLVRVVNMCCVLRAFLVVMLLPGNCGAASRHGIVRHATAWLWCGVAPHVHECSDATVGGGDSNAASAM